MERSTVIPTLTDPTDFDIADNAFNTHYDDVDFDLANIREKRQGDMEESLPEDLTQEIGAAVDANAMYRDEEDFVYSAIRQELERANNLARFYPDTLSFC